MLQPIFEPRFIEDSFACRPGKGTHAGMRRAAEFAARFPVALKCDIRRYFPGIDHEVLPGRIRRVVADPAVLGLIGNILESHREASRRIYGASLFDTHSVEIGLPIGNLTSQFFANVHLDGFDHFVKQALRVRSALCGRFPSFRSRPGHPARSGGSGNALLRQCRLGDQPRIPSGGGSLRSNKQRPGGGQ